MCRGVLLCDGVWCCVTVCSVVMYCAWLCVIVCSCVLLCGVAWRREFVCVVCVCCLVSSYAVVGYCCGIVSL